MGWEDWCDSFILFSIGLLKRQALKGLMADTLHVSAAMWVLAFRDKINHGNDNTTAHCEGSHSSTKSQLRARGGEAIRCDKLAWFFLNVVLKQAGRREASYLDGKCCHMM